MKKLVPVACQRHAIMLMGKLEDGIAGGIAGQSFAQQRDFVAKLLKQITQNRRVRPGQTETSL